MSLALRKHWCQKDLGLGFCWVIAALLLSMQLWSSEGACGQKALSQKKSPQAGEENKELLLQFQHLVQTWIPGVK